MPRKDFTLLIVLILITGFFMLFRPSYGLWLQSFFTPRPVSNAAMSTQAEIDALKAQIAANAPASAAVPSRYKNAAAAVVYSRYPLNFKNELLINIGTNEGVRAGDAVVWNDILIGRVRSADLESAAVQTVFDSGMKLAVRIGTAGVDALLQGGTLPTLSLIPKNAIVNTGDAVISAAPGLPYGISVGEVSEVGMSPDKLFQAAVLAAPYDLNGIRNVFVLAHGN